MLTACRIDSGNTLLKSALIGSLVTFALAVVPVVHLVTIWPAPFLGGFIAGSRSAPLGGQAMVIGAVMGVIMALPAYAILWVAGFFLGFSMGNVFGIAIALFFAIYIIFLGTLGAMFGSSIARKT